jgi:hypothetical protein
VGQVIIVKVGSVFLMDALRCLMIAVAVNKAIYIGTIAAAIKKKSKRTVATKVARKMAVISPIPRPVSVVTKAMSIGLIAVATSGNSNKIVEDRHAWSTVAVGLCPTILLPVTRGMFTGMTAIKTAKT